VCFTLKALQAFHLHKPARRTSFPHSSSARGAANVIGFHHQESHYVRTASIRFFTRSQSGCSFREVEWAGVEAVPTSWQAGALSSLRPATLCQKGEQTPTKHCAHGQSFQGKVTLSLPQVRELSMLLLREKKTTKKKKTIKGQIMTRCSTLKMFLPDITRIAGKRKERI